MILDKKNIRFLSMLGHRGAFSVAITELSESLENLIVLTADLTSLTGLDRFKNLYPKKIYNVGIAEQNMIGIAAGMAKAGFIVFATTYANFITMRSYEQIRLNLGYMKFNVKIIGTGAGLCMGMSGNSHYSIEDIALIRAIPNMIVLSPADDVEVVKAIFAAASIAGPVYIRLTGGLNNPSVYNKDYDFKIGKAIVMKEGDDIAIFATGTMVYESIIAADILEKGGISVSVINMHTIKPLDRDVINDMLKKVKLIVTIEEHSIIGGLGSAIAEYKSTLNTNVPQLFLGINDKFQNVGEYEYLLRENGLKGLEISKKIINKYIEMEV